MGIVLTFLKSFWKEIAIVIAVVLVYGWIYQKGYSNGKEACEQAHLESDQARDAAINERIDKLASGSTKIANETKKSAGNINKQIEELLINLRKDPKSGPLVIIKDGNCVPDKTFVDAINAINGAANEKK